MTPTPPAPTRPSAHIPELDGVRGLAVLLILACHYVSPDWLAGRVLAPARLALSASWMGVELFFVLSGFLITGILLDSPRERGTLRGFYVRRGLRIVPLYYLALVLALVVLPQVVPYTHPEDADLLRRQGWGWTYLLNVGPILSPPTDFQGHWAWLGHFWSLAVENHFYLVWPLLVLSTSRATLVRICLAVMALSPVIRVVLRASTTLPPDAYYKLTPLRLDPLMLGALLALWARRGDTPEAMRRLALGAMGGAVAGLVALGAWRGTLDFADAGMQALGFTLAATASGSLLIASIASGTDSVLRRSMRSVPMRSLGQYSYGIYVFHGLIRPTLQRDLSVPRLRAWIPSAPLAAAAHLALMFGLSFALAWLSWHLFEKHFLRLKDVLAPRRDRRPDRPRPHVAPSPTPEDAPALP